MFLHGPRQITLPQRREDARGGLNGTRRVKEQETLFAERGSLPVHVNLRGALPAPGGGRPLRPLALSSEGGKETSYASPSATLMKSDLAP